MKTHTVKFVERHWVAIQTAAYVLERPSGYDYKAGQFTEVKAGDLSHTFTLASAPHEEHLMFATRMRGSDFKRNLDEMSPGATLRIAPAEGGFTLPNGGGAAVFIAGGIGVTPVRSIVLDALHRKLDWRMHFFYANHRPEDAAFLEELRRLDEENDSFKMTPTITRPDISRTPWDGETGRIDMAMIREHASDLDRAQFYVCGPPNMVDATTSLLEKEGVPEERIHAEQFAGY